jgi:hypothetical protein
MKNMKRAYRRYKKEVLLKRRARNYYDYSWSLSVDNTKSWADFYNDVESGEVHTWMRNTGKPCSCSLCSSEKYVRISASEVCKIIRQQLE